MNVFVGFSACCRTIRKKCVKFCMHSDSHELVEERSSSNTDQNYNIYARQAVIRRKKHSSVLDEGGQNAQDEEVGRLRFWCVLVNAFMRIFLLVMQNCLLHGLLFHVKFHRT